jgi:antitoxin component YwqK of YwqJK toxin-antitoxin module
MGKEMYINGMMNYKDVRPHESKDGLGHVRIWHRSNGELAFEAFYTGDKVYQGLMTEYDEDGNIIMQERYEDGELIETIKEKP